MIIIPPRDTKKITQNNRSKILGTLVSSFGLDLQSELGLIKASPRLIINTSGTPATTNQGTAIGFKTFDQLVFTVAGTRIFKSSAFNLVSLYTEDASSGAITTYDSNYSDIEVFNNVLCTTATAKLMSKTTDGAGGGAWTKRYDLTTSTSLHKLCYLAGTNRLYFIDDFSSIKSSDTSWSVATSGNYFISIPYTSGLIYTMCSDKTNLWIGTVNQVPSGLLDSFKGGRVLVWDGISSTATTEYTVKAQGILALCKNDRGIMHAIDTNGALLAFTGDGFEEIDRLPIKKELLANALSGLYNSFIHPNGFTFSRNGTFLVLVNNLLGDNTGTIKENFPSGIWEWSKDTGFIHRQAASLTTISGLTVTDYGQNRVSRVGALYEPDIYSASASGKPTLICGIDYYTDSSTVVNGIFIDDSLNNIQKCAYFVTPWIQSQNLKDNWKTIALKYRKLLDSGDKIMVKYRLTEADPVEFTMTWVNTTTFTTTTNILGREGQEVEVLQATGSGKCAHIVSIANNNTSYTVVLDDTFTGVTTGTGKARVQAWIKTLTISDQKTESVIKTIANATSERIQLKVCMQFTGDDELHEVALISSPQTILE